MRTNHEDLIAKVMSSVGGLPAFRIEELLDYIEFQKNHEEKTEDPILKVAGVLSGEPISSKEIDEELYLSHSRI
ncbi:MAG: hypothetical protein COS57_01535 [Syntrophobacterales bacterium CG03_land_8_20_14_0_80_58_14]|nr:MAG: hypothetical protein COS57_01535 [Syntrophobacterales bacterium CG03_land_8_20_14_0_80_58_14]